MRKLLFVLLSVLLLAACGGGEDEAPVAESDSQKEPDTTETEEVEDVEEQPDEEEENSNDDIYFKDNVAKIEDVMVEITNTKVIQPGEEGNEYGDKPVFAIWYEATNFTDKDIDPITAWFAIFTAIQDNDPNMINELNVGMLPDQAHLDTQMNTIKKDGTVENSISYELDDLETPVTLVATQGLMGDEIGRADYEIK